MKKTLAPFAAALCAMLVAAPPARATAIGSNICYQPGLDAGCVYLVRYDNGEVSQQTADAQGRITRPCNRIITGVERDNTRSCSRVQPIAPTEV